MKVKIARFLPLLATAQLLAAPPTPQDDTAIVAPGKQVEIKVLANDTDPDVGEDLTIQPNPTGALHGTPTVNGNSILYQADASLETTDEFTYTVSDGTNTATAKVTVATLAAIKGTYAGLATVDADPSIEPGKVQVQLTSLASATTRVTWQGVPYPAKKPLYGVDGRATLVLTKRAGGHLELSFELKPGHQGDTASHRLVGDLRDLDAGGQTITVATFDLGHTPFAADEAAQRPTAGRYTSFLQGDGSSPFSEPGGFNIFTINARTTSGKIIGQMPDGEVFSAGSPYAGHRYVINQRLYKAIQKANPTSKNYVAGEPLYKRSSMITRGASLDDQLDARLSWQRGANASSTYYPGGITAFRNLLLLARGYRIVPRRYPPPLDFAQDGSLTNGEVTLQDGNLAAPMTRLVNVKFGPKVIVPKDTLALHIKIAGNSGVFTGSFKHPVANKIVKFKGAFDETAGEGRGAFQDTTERGLVIIRPNP
jgi:hypothetical protein